LIPVEVIEQLTGQIAGIDSVILAPLPLLLAAISRTDIAFHPKSFELSIQRVA
jgi:hypothetical protein